MSCCSERVFECHQDPELADIGKSEGVEYTVGRCRNCGAVLLNFWVGGVTGGTEVVSQSLIDSFLSADHELRKVRLSDWFNGRDPAWLAKRLEQLVDEAASVSWDDMPKTWWDKNAKGLSAEFGAWISRISDLLRTHFEEPSPVYWAIANADRRVDDIFAEPRSSFERVKDLYLKALRLALKDLRAKDPGAGDSR